MQGIRDAKNNPRDYGIEGKDDGDKITRYVWGGIEDQPNSQSVIDIVNDLYCKQTDTPF